MSNTNSTNDRPSGVGLQEVTAITWTDNDDGTQYRRTVEDGEIVEREVGCNA